jgi:signal peptidase I
MKLPSLEDEGERRIVDKRLRLLATVSLLSMITPILFSSFTVHTTFVIASSSMTPTLMPGDIVTTSLTNGEIANGTIIVFKSPFGGYEAHRVVGESSLGKDVYYSTKGDANNRTDSFLVSGAYIVGSVSRVIPKLGLFFMIPREIVLLATISLVFLYVFLTFKTRDESDKRESTAQLKEDQEQRRKKRIFQTCCVISILALTNCLTSFASIKLIYCTSPNTVSLTSPKVVLQNGNTGSGTIYDNGINANVTVQALLWLSSWKYRLQMTLDHNDVTSNLSNFSTLIYLFSSSGINGADVTNIFNEVGSNNKKIAVTTSDGITQCYVEIEKWDSVSKKAWLWVKVPSISTTTDTVLYIYYDSSQQDNTAYVGDPGSVTAQNVWESNFKAVLHLPETSGTQYDSTPNSNNGTPQGGVAQGAAGKVDGADTFDGTSGYLNYGLTASLNFGTNSPFTYEGWVKTTESYGAIISQRHGTDDGAVIDICVGYDGAVRSAGRLMGLVRQSSSSSGYARVTGPIVNDGNWHYFTLTRNSGNTIELFVDGISQGTASGSASGGAITTNLRALGSERRWVQVGYGTADDRYLSGAVDEVRISNTQRSAAWIKTSYESERDHFVSWGSEERNSVTYDYVLSVSNSITDPWRIRLRTYSDSNVNRLGNCTIYLHNGGTSRQIYINGGSYVQQVGDWYDLAASGTDYIAICVSANSQGASIIYAYLEVQVQNSGVSMLYKITFNVT